MLWDFDTVHEYQTVNGVKASRGATDDPDPVIANGMLLLCRRRLAARCDLQDARLLTAARSQGIIRS